MPENLSGALEGLLRKLRGPFVLNFRSQRAQFKILS